jgi:NSS family neurotransmitter:Na+ symporter
MPGLLSALTISSKIRLLRRTEKKMQQEISSGSAPRISLHGNWSSRMAFILAVTGSAVGLGNIWKFPYIAGQNGGGAFVLVYLFCVFVIGMPVMMSEILIGRRGRRNPVATMALLGEEEGHSRHWQWVGAMGVVAGVLVLSYYSVVAGWTMAYVQKSMSGVFAGATAAEVGGVFKSFTGSVLRSSLVHTLFMGSTIFVVARGVERGLEQAVKFMVPALLLLMLVLLGYAINSGSFGVGLAFMFTPNFAALTWDGVLTAMGQAFFTLSLGMGAVMAYGAYLPEETSITSTTAAVVLADTTFAVLAGLVIFPLVFANGLNPSEGPGLVFDTLPLAFGQMPGGALFATIFFILLSFAAWTSALGVMEPAVGRALSPYTRTGRRDGRWRDLADRPGHGPVVQCPVGIQVPARHHLRQCRLHHQQRDVAARRSVHHHICSVGDVSQCQCGRTWWRRNDL